MSIAITSLMLWGYCFFLNRFLRWSIESLPFFVISFAIIFVYFFSYVGLMKESAILLLLIGSVLLLTAPLYLANMRNKFWLTYFTPGIIVYILFMALLSMFLSHSIIVGSDDYGKWLDHAKIIFFKNSFLNSQDETGSLEYPPGGGLLGYLFLQLGSYKDEKLFFAQELLILTPLLILLKQYTWQNWFDAFILFFIWLISSMFIFEVPLGPRISLMMDTPVGCYFGAILASYYLLIREKYLWLYLLIPIMAMTIFRPMVLPLIMVIFFIILLDQYLLYSFNDAQRRKKLAIVGFFSLILGSILIQQSWQKYVFSLGINSPWEFKNLLTAILHNGSLLNAHEFQQCMKIYFSTFMKALLFPLGLSILLGCLLYYSKNKLIRYRILWSQLILLVAFVLYSVMSLLYFLYLMLPLQENIAIVSFNRFFYIYITGWLIISLAQIEIILNRSYGLSQLANMVNIKIVLFKKFIDEYPFGKIINNKTLLTVCLVILLYSYFNATVSRFHTHRGFDRNWQYVRHVVAKNLAQSISGSIEPESKIGIFMSTNFPEILFGITLKFELLPRRTYIYELPLIAKNSFEQEIKKLDYVFLMNVDNSFWFRFGSYFIPNRWQNPAGCIMNSQKQFICNTILYKVNHQDDKLYLTQTLEKHITF